MKEEDSLILGFLPKDLRDFPKEKGQAGRFWCWHGLGRLSSCSAGRPHRDPRVTTQSLTLVSSRRKHWREGRGLWGPSDAALAPNHRKFQGIPHSQGKQQRRCEGPCESQFCSGGVNSCIRQKCCLRGLSRSPTAPLVVPGQVHSPHCVCSPPCS